MSVAKLVKTMLTPPIAAISVILTALSVSAAYLDVATDKDPIAYAVGETATLTFTASAGSVDDYTWAWTVAGDDGFRKEGAGNVVSVSCAKPGFVRVDMSATPAGGGTKISYTASVGFGVDQIQPDGQRPEDLKGFWDNRLKAIQDAIDPSKVSMEYTADANGCHIYKVKLDDLPDGLGPCTGWLSIPVGADSGTKYRADGFFFGYDNSWSSDNRARPTSPPNNYIQFRVMAHAFELEQDQAYYDDFKAGTQSRGKTHGLDPVQNANPLTSYFNGMACRDIRAMLFLKTLEAWDGVTLTATGHSQGGLQCIWAGLAPGVTQINPECPWNCNMYGQAEAGRVRNDRLHPAWAPGLAYYDPCFVGRLIPTDCIVNLTRAGLADYTCPPSCVAAFYNTLPQEKSIRWLQGSDHGQDSKPTVQHWFDASADKDTAFNAATDYADTKEFVPVEEEVKWDDGYCGDISDLSGLTNRFVSYGGTWGANDQKYKMVQDAIAKAKAGDVIWIHDGFICKPESDKDYIGSDSGNSTKAHFEIAKDITLRSVSGDARGYENPPVLQGRFHDEEGAKTNPCHDTWIGPKTGGTLAIRALKASKGTFKGLVFEHSAHGGWHPSYANSAIYGSGFKLDKCVVRDCHSETSLLASGITITDCVISNNTGASISGSSKLTARGSYFVKNSGTVISLSADSDVGSVVSNCVFDGNSGSDGGAMYSKSGVLVTQCRFTNNRATVRGGAYYGNGTLTNCAFYGNTMYKNTANYEQGGGAVGGLSTGSCVLYDCTVVSNGVYYGSRMGGGVYQVTAYRTLIASNYVCNANGGGAANSILYDCQILNNDSVNTTSTDGGRGGGICGGSATRCVIANNTVQPLNNPANCGRGGGAYDASLYNCVVSNNYSRSTYGNRGGSVCLTTAGREVVNTLVVGNRAPESGSAGIVDETSGGCAVKNCTVAGNTSKSGNKGCVTVAAVNTIVWNNSGSAASTYVSAQNSCLDVDVSDTATYPGCISEDPKFTNNGFSDYELDKDSPCVDTALTQQWMLEVGSPLSKALNGNDRVIGVKPDMGCFELYKKDVPTTCTVTFDLGEHGVRTGGGDLLQLVAYETAAIAPTVEPNHCLWAFVGWDKDFSCVTEDMTVTAQYEAIDPETVQHTVTFDIGTHGERTGGGELEQTVTHFHAAVEPEFTQHEGWVFLNWDKDISSVESDLDVKAVWKRVEILPVEGEGEEDAPIKVETLTALTNRFVSSTGDWGGNNQRYTDLEDAMNKSYPGDVIWMRNGYVERPADASDYVSGDASTRTHFKFTKAVTVRSLLGDARVDTNPPRIWGRWHDPDADPVVKAGANAIRALNVSAAANFVGIVFENSSALSTASGPGGCLVGDGKATFRKCIVRNNVSNRGAVSSTTFKFYDCVVSNNVGTGICGSDIFDSELAGNSGGAIAYFSTRETPIVVSNCFIHGNTTSATCGGAAIGASSGSYHNYYNVYDCVISNNTSTTMSGGIYGAGIICGCRIVCNAATSQGGGVGCYSKAMNFKIYDSVIAGNASGGDGGGVFRGAELHGCTIADNVAKGEGGGAYNCDLYDCQVLRNETVNASGSSGGKGGGIRIGSATRCVIADNMATNYVHAGGTNGGATSDVNLYDCIITGNVSCNAYGAGGVVVFTSSGHEVFNCLIAGNRETNKGVGGISSGGDTLTNFMYNCTVTANTGKGIGGCRKMVTVNTISWGNTGAADTFLAATNCCSAALADTEKYPGCITEDPRFYDDGSWTLRLRSPCKDTAMPFKWMTDPADARSKDLAGNDRVAGAGPDMGCYERQTKIGTTIIVK